MNVLDLGVSEETLSLFSQRWNVRELAIFGSALRSDFRPDSDIDVLVTFESTAQWGVFALVQMQQELETLFGRPVDLINRRAVERSTNWIRRQSILQTATAIYPLKRIVLFRQQDLFRIHVISQTLSRR